MNRPPRWRITTNITLLICGAGLYTIAAPPYGWSIAVWIALTPFFLVLRNTTPRAAFMYGALFGLLFSLGITFWAYSAVAAYFPLPFPLSLVFTLLIYVIFVCPYTGLAATLASRLMRNHGSFLSAIGVAAVWVAGEFARASLFSGFAWEFLGHTQYRQLTLIQITDVTGVYGLSFLIALCSYSVAELLSMIFRFKFWVAEETSNRKREAGSLSARISSREARTPNFPWPALACCFAGVTLTLLYGAIRLRQYQSAPAAAEHGITVALSQGNVPGVQRWQRTHYANTLFRYAAATQQGIGKAQPHLVVWPEFAVGFYLDREPVLQAQLGQFLHRMQAPLLLGAPRQEEIEGKRHYYNSAYFLSTEGELLDVYDKIHLLPFAEYRPFALPAVSAHSQESPSDFTAGTRSTVFPLRQGAFGVLICYEATYSALAHRLVRDGAEFLVNMSNDTWLVAGGEVAAAQHFSLTVFRAVETRRFLARVTTGGISGFVDPAGRPYQLSTAAGDTILGTVFPRKEMTFYVRYGDWFAWCCLCVAILTSLPHGTRMHAEGETP